MSRKMTLEEVENRFLDHVRSLVDYWLAESRVENERKRLEGLAFSILVALDGCAGDLPGFIVAPLPHENDKKFHQDEGEDWWPENHGVEINANIAGTLHDNFYPSKGIYDGL